MFTAKQQVNIFISGFFCVTLKKYCTNFFSAKTIWRRYQVGKNILESILLYLCAF